MIDSLAEINVIDLSYTSLSADRVGICIEYNSQSQSNLSEW